MAPWILSLPDVWRRPVQLVAVPYYAWANRDPGAMRVRIARHMP